MRIRSVLPAGVLLVLGAACSASQQAPAQPEYNKTATIKDIMDSMVDPSADAIWGSVAQTGDAAGFHAKFPQNDEEWNEVRRRAVTLMGSTDLLLMPGRSVARSGDKSENPGIELSPEEVQALVNQDRESFNEFAHNLHDTALVSLQAIDAKNKNALFDSGDAIDKACESCHLKYWYPNEAKSLAAAAAGTPGR